MNSVIAALRVNLGLDSAQFETGSKRVEQRAKGMSAGVKTAFLAVAVAAAAATAAFTIALKGQIDAADDLGKSAQSIGVAVEELSALRYAADLSGVSAESLDTAVGKLSRTMNDMAKGVSSSGTKAFERLGISVTNADGKLKSSTEVLADISDRFAAMPDGAAKTAMAIEIFGRSGAALIPLLNAGSSGIRAMADEARQLGVVISGETAKRAEAFNDNLSRMGYAASGLAVVAMSALLPALVTVSNGMVALAMSSEGIISALANVAQYAGIAVAGIAGFFAPAILGGLTSVSMAIGTTMVGAVRTLTLAMMANPLGLLVGGIAAAITAAFVFRDNIKQAIGIDAVEIIKTAANLLIQSFDLAFRNIATIWGKLPGILGDITISTANAVIGGIETMINGAIRLINDFTRGAREGLGALKIEVGDIGRVSLGGVDNPYAGALGGLGAALAQNLTDTKEINYVDGLASAIGSMWTSADGATAALAGLGDELGGGDTGGGTTGALHGAKAATDALSESMKAAQQFGQQVSSTLASGFADLFKGMITGSQSAMESIAQLLSKLGDMFLNQGFQALFGGGGGGGGLGGIISSIFGGLFGGGLSPGGAGFLGGGAASWGSFAGGGFTGPGSRTGGIDGMGGFPAILHPNETVLDHTKGQGMGGGLTVHIDARGAQMGVAEQLDQWARFRLPALISQHNADPLARG